MLCWFMAPGANLRGNMKIVIWAAAALAAYFLATQLIDLGASFMLVAISFIAGVYFVAEGVLDFWTEIESAKQEKDEK